MKTQLLLPAALLFVSAVLVQGQNQQIPNGDFEAWHSQGQGEDPDDWGSLFNQFNLNPGMVTKSSDAHSGAFALKIVCDTGSVFWIPGNIIYGSLNLGLINGQVSNAKVPFSSVPDSLTGYMKGTVINGGFYMNMALFKSGSNIATATYFIVSSQPDYVRFSVPVNYSQSETPDTMTFTIVAAHPGLNPPAHPDNEFYIDGLTLIYNSTLSGNVRIVNESSVYPNPVSTETLISICTYAKNATLDLYNSNGQNVKHISNLTGNTFKLQCENLPEGVYFIRIAEGNKILGTGKIVVID